MSQAPVFKFSHHFSAAIWSSLAVQDRNLLILETRNDKDFQVQFSALDFETGKFIWENLKLAEQWWIGLTAANSKTVLFHTYVDKGNPDHKNLVAYDIFDQKVRWEVKEFSFFDWNASVIWGYKTDRDLTPAEISIETGVITEAAWKTNLEKEANEIVKPIRYLEGNPHFNTIREFVQQKSSHLIVKGAEYTEWRDLIILSVYADQNEKLANYLIVFDQQGQLLMEEKLGENLAGLGTDTFFMLSGCLFLIKNRSELVVYTL